MKLSASNYLIPGIVVSMLIWGLGWPSAKVLTSFGSAINIALLRFAITFFTILAILFFTKTKITISKNGLIPLLGASVLMACYSLLFFNGVQHGLAGAGGVLVTTMTPIFTYIISILIAKRYPTKQETIGLVLGLLAACFLLSIFTDFKNIFQSGNIYFLLSCLLWVFLSRITANTKNYGSPFSFSMWMYLCCCIILLFFSSYIQLHTLVHIQNKTFWYNLIFNGIINTGLATTFYFYATSKLGAAQTSSFIYIVPFAAAFFSWLFLHETIHWNTIVGGLLGIMAVYVLNRKKEIE